MTALALACCTATAALVTAAAALTIATLARTGDDALADLPNNDKDNDQ